MGSTRALLAAAVVAVGVSSGAVAADLLPPPPPPPPMEHDYGSWYLRGDVGVGASEISGWRDTLAPVNAFGNPPPAVIPVFADLGDSAFAGIGVGYKLNSWLRFDVTGEYRGKASYSSAVTWFDNNGAVGADVYTANLRTALFMANGYVDLGTWWGITPYVGGGVGVAARQFTGFIDHGFGYAQDSWSSSFAWSAMAGLALHVTPNLMVDLGYRYLDMGDMTGGPIHCLQAAACWGERHHFHVASHDVRLGLRYAFGGFTPPPPGPLVAKY